MGAKRKPAPAATIQQAAVLAWRRRPTLEVLLITSLDTGRWVVPKGRVEHKEPLRSAARREALEEAGLEGPVGVRPLGTYAYDKELPGGGTQSCFVTVFAMQVDVQRARWPERERRRKKWHSIPDAAAAVQEDDLRKIILAFTPR